MSEYEVVHIEDTGTGSRVLLADAVQAASYSPNGDYIEFFKNSERVASYLQPLKVRKLQGDEDSDTKTPEFNLLHHIYDQYVSAKLSTVAGQWWHIRDGDIGKVRSLTTDAGHPLWSPAPKIGDPDLLMGYPIFPVLPNSVEDVYEGVPTLI